MSRNKPIKFAIVGCGMISEFQADAIRKVPGARLVAFCDTHRPAAEARAATFGGTVYTCVETMLRNQNIDAVSICTPSGMHMETAIAAATAGKHVMVEKPIEVSLSRVDRIIAACRKNGVKLGAIFPRRFADSSILLKQAVDSGRFGSIALADVYIKWYREPAYYSRGGWRGTKRYDGGGSLMNQGIHGVDLLQWLMGGVKKVSAFAARRFHSAVEVEDVAVASLSFRCGALGVIEGTTAAWPGTGLRIEIAGTDGTVIMEHESFLTWQFRRETAADAKIRRRFKKVDTVSTGGATDPRSINSEGHRRQFEDFVAAIRDDRQPRIDGSEARAAVAVIDAIYRSASGHRVVTVK